MPDNQPRDGIQLRRADSSERFVAFAFAAADLVAEIDSAGVITYAAGAYRSKFGSAPEFWIGRPLHDMILQIDHYALNRAMTMLAERGRLLPWTARLANPQRTEVALAGLRLAPEGRPVRMCVTFALPPSPPAIGVQPGAAQAFASTLEPQLRAGLREIGMLEVQGGSVGAAGRALEALIPGSMTSEIGPGRYGLTGPEASGPDLVRIAASLEAILRDQGVVAIVSSQRLPLDSQGLSQRQTARVLRRALDTFSQRGLKGVNEAGFEHGLTNYVQAAMGHVRTLRRAITEKRFELVYQPIVDLKTREMHHVEALLRPMPVPNCLLKTPQDFVMLAETVGLAAELDLAVASAVCDAAVQSTVQVAFNLSGQSMQESVFRDRLASILTSHPARKARKLVVEMTETAQLEDVDEAARTAHMIRDMGIPFCLDDFGAGAADMRVLRAMPADIVKIDGAYIPGIVSDNQERAFVSGMIEIARASGAKVVAERVETQEEADALKRLEVDYGQGWFFGRPGALLVLPPTTSIRRRNEMEESWS